MEVSANRRRRPAPDIVPGQRVWAQRRNISTTRPSSKMDVCRLGPFAIMGPVGSSDFSLDLSPSMHIHSIFHVSRLAPLPTMHIHPLFHVSLLEPHVAKTFPDRVVEAPLPI